MARNNPSAVAYARALPAQYRGFINRASMAQTIGFGIHAMHYRLSWGIDGRVTMTPDADNAWKEWARQDQADYDAWQDFESARIAANQSDIFVA